MLVRTPIPFDQERWNRRVDGGLNALLFLQGFTLFAAIPLLSGSAAGRLVLDGCHLAFAIICISVMTHHRGIRLALALGLMLLVAGPSLDAQLTGDLRLSLATRHELVALAAFAFDGGVTALVTRHVFASGQVNAHRIRGATLLYLNVSSLFAIAYGAVAMYAHGAFALASGAAVPDHGGAGMATYTYFSLATITTTGYGDVVPLHPLARSLTNLESVFGALFSPTLLTRLVSLHLSRENSDPPRQQSEASKPA